jgi:hypothetical protein
VWTLYGVLVNDFAIIAANSMVFVQAATILMFKCKFN